MKITNRFSTYSCMEKRGKNNNGILISISFTSFIYPFMISGLAVALPTMGTYFQISPGRLGLIETSYLAATLLLLLPAGKYADKVGLGRIYTIGMVLFIITSFLLGFSRSFNLLLFLRFLQGFAVAMLTATGIAILTKTYPAEKRGYVLGIAIGAVYVGLSAGPFIGGYLTDQLGWQYIFISGGCLSVIALFLILKNISFEKKKNDVDYNYLSALQYMIFLALIWLGFANFQYSNLYIILSFIGIIGFIIFLYNEDKSPNPIIDVRLFRTNQSFSLGASLTYINYASSVAVTFFFSLYLQYIKGLSPQAAGTVLIIQPIIQSIFAPVSGRLSDRYNPNILVMFGMLSCFIGLGIVLLVNQDASMVLIYSLLVFFGLGFALFSSANTNQVMSSVSFKHYGIASSMVGAMRTVGMLTSISIASGILTFYLGEQQMSTGLENLFIRGMKLSFMIFIFISLIGILLSIKLFRLNKKQGRSEL